MPTNSRLAAEAIDKATREMSVLRVAWEFVKDGYNVGTTRSGK